MVDSNADKSTVASLAIFSLIIGVVAALALSIGLGFLLGAGAGWLCFALLCAGAATWGMHRAKVVAAELKAKDTSQEQVSE